MVGEVPARVRRQGRRCAQLPYMGLDRVVLLPCPLKLLPDMLFLVIRQLEIQAVNQRCPQEIKQQIFCVVPNRD